MRRSGGRWGGERRGEIEDRRWFYPGRIQNRGKSSLPFTTREPDYVPTSGTVRRAGDFIDKANFHQSSKNHALTSGVVQSTGGDNV